MKVLIETTSNIALLDLNTGDFIDDTIPTLTRWTAFLEARAGLGQIRVLHRGFRDEATQEEWLEYIKASKDVESALAAFIASYAIQEPPGTKREAVHIEEKIDEIAPSKPRARKG